MIVTWLRAHEHIDFGSDEPGHVTPPSYFPDLLSEQLSMVKTCSDFIHSSFILSLLGVKLDENNTTLLSASNEKKHRHSPSSPARGTANSCYECINRIQLAAVNGYPGGMLPLLAGSVNSGRWQILTRGEKVYRISVYHGGVKPWW